MARKAVNPGSRGSYGVTLSRMYEMRKIDGRWERKLPGLGWVPVNFPK